MAPLVKPWILKQPLSSFVGLLNSQGIFAFHAIYNNATRRVIASHQILQPIADYFVAEGTDFNAHEGIFGQIGTDSGVLQGAFVHRTHRGLGAGGVRNWTYATVEDWFRDGLRLSKGMTHKNSLAGLWWGGGKGLLARNTGVGLRSEDAPKQRRTVYEEYGKLLSALKGCYVTAEDVGTTVEDMVHIYSQTRFTTCIPARLGGSGNPSRATAFGVVRGLEAAFAHANKSLDGARIAVQGMGHVAAALIEFLLEKNVSKIIASDLDSYRIQQAENFFEKAIRSKVLSLRLTDDMSILYEDVDALSPCAVGGILNPKTIPNIKAKIVCGAANNQLGDLFSDDKLLAKRRITYVPDFLVNRMGIVNCADEAIGYVTDDPNLEKHLGDEWNNSIYNLTRRVLVESEASGRTPQDVAINLAEERSFEPHPIWGHRGVQIIESVVNSPEWRLKMLRG